MTWRNEVVGLACVVSAAVACAPRVAPTVSPDPVGAVATGSTSTLVVLLPNAETGKTGKAIVRSDTASVELKEAFESTMVRKDSAPERVVVLTKADFDGAFAEAVAAMPPTPRSFILHFLFESDQLTDAGQALLPAVLASVRDYPAPIVTVIGHTDTAGSRTINFELGQQRAEVVKRLLVEIGLDSESVEVVSHGETDPLVLTADGVLEPVNRRVEVVIR